MNNEAAWHQDPTGRFANRWWNGTAWTDHVADEAGVTSTDAMADPAAATGDTIAEPAVGASSSPAKHGPPTVLFLAGAAALVLVAIIGIGGLGGGSGSSSARVDAVDLTVLREQLPLGLDQLDFEMSYGAVDITPSTGSQVCTDGQAGLDEYLALGTGFPGDMADPWDRSVDAYTRAVSSCQDGDVDAMVGAMTEGRQATDEFLAAADEQCESDPGDPFYVICS